MLTRLSATAARRQAKSTAIRAFSAAESMATSTPGSSSSSASWGYQTPSLQKGAQPPARRLNESQAFTQMYQSLFPTSPPKATPSSSPRPAQPATSPALDAFFQRHASESLDPSRRHFRAFLQTKHAEIDACADDHELIAWTSNLFTRIGELESPGVDSASRDAELRAYPRLLSAVIRTLRDRYHDPHSALAVFHHARHSLGVRAYLAGCTTATYNELLTTLWLCFRDLEAVASSLEEMIANGVEPDEKTRGLVERITLGGEEEKWVLLNRMEELVGMHARTRVGSDVGRYSTLGHLDG